MRSRRRARLITLSVAASRRAVSSRAVIGLGLVRSMWKVWVATARLFVPSVGLESAALRVQLGSRALVSRPRVRPRPGGSWSTRAGRWRDAEVLTDLAGKRVGDPAVARDGGRAGGVDAPVAVPASFSQQAGAVRAQGGARGRAASRSDDELERFAVGRGLGEGVLAEAQLEDAVKRVDHVGAPARGCGPGCARRGPREPRRRSSRRQRPRSRSSIEAARSHS